MIGSRDWLLSPEASFHTLLAQLGLVAQRTLPAPATSPEEESIATDIRQVRAVLEQQRKPDAERLIEEYRKLRERLRTVREAGDLENIIAAAQRLGDDGIPEEFMLYLQGAACYRADSAGRAMEFWQVLLELPLAERRYRSTWAAYMLGRAVLETRPELAADQFETTRRLAAQGCFDPLDLANATHGWEAQAHLRAGRYGVAIDLYLRQTAGSSVIESLRTCAARALDESTPDRLAALAGVANHRKVMTAFLISGGLRRSSSEPASDRLARWLAAIEAAQVRDDSLAAALALAAYQAGEMDEARRWIAASRKSPLSSWLAAKLLLQEGQIDEAAKMLREVVRVFPGSAEEPRETEQTLWLGTERYETVSADRHLLAELGAVELHRGDFLAALDAFMQAAARQGAFWEDAAFVAERILTADELKRYVIEFAMDDRLPTAPHLRHLLARRLLRLNRGGEAREFYPPAPQNQFDALADHLRAGFQPASASEERARHLFAAARLMRRHGLELLGTELEPDWAISEGNFETGLTAADRRAHSAEQLLPTAAETERIIHSALKFSKRWHYRYVAAELGWMAAALLPDQSEETAEILNEAGSWIKYLDPPRADRFFKALVKRCGKTALGQEAHALRWFPTTRKERPEI